MTPKQRRLVTAQLARRYGLDPRAVLAVAGVEGGFSGAVGDSGTSFGPFQLHWGGAMPRQYVGNRAASQRFANSRAGINYALRQMAGVARGKRGRAAVEAIVRRFERPADPTSEIQRAMGLYGKSPVPKGGGPISFGGGGGGGVGGGGNREALLRAIMAQNAAFASGQGLDPTAMTAVLLSTRLGQSAATPGGPGGNAGVSLGKPSAKGGPQAMLAAIRLAKKMGLSARENPFTDPVDPVHVEGSYHYRRFKDNPRTRFNESRLGRGLDVSGGTPAQLRRYARLIDRMFNPSELFHDPLGGKFRIGGHGKHVHVGF